MRAILRARGFAASAVGTMALAIGAVVTILTVVDRVLLRDLPFDGSDRVMQICEVSTATGTSCSASPRNVEDLARDAAHLEAAGVARGEGFTAEIDGERVPVRGAIASPGYFNVLAVRPAMGRLLADTDMPAGANQVVVVSHAFWRERLGASPDAVGRTLRLDSRDVRVIGVLPADAFMPFFAGAQLWKPISAGLDDASNRAWRGFIGLAKARRESPRGAVEAEMTARYAALATAYPDANQGWALQIENLRDRMVRPVRQPILLFQIAVALLLLIACANVAGLLLVRRAAREAEFAIRRALGAGRMRLTRQLFAEALILSVASAVIGLGVAAFALRALAAIAPPDMPRLAEVAIDARVAGAAFILGLLTAVAFSLVPAGGRSLVSTLRAQRHGGSQGRLQRTFAIGQIALALALLASAALVTRTFARLSAWEPGFARANVVTAFTVAPPDRVGTIDNAVGLLIAARAAVAAVPGVTGAGLVSAGPLFGGEETGELRVDDRPDGGRWTVRWYDADEGYFPALGVTPLRGRLIAASDVHGGERVAVVNDALARQVFGDGDAIGRRVTVEDHTAVIVGVVPSFVPAPGASARPEIYWPIRQYRRYAAYLVVRGAAGAPPSAQVLRRAIADATPLLEPGAMLPLDTRFASAMLAPRFSMWLAIAFAFVAGTVAAVGLYVVIASAVADRRHEIGVRLALGASPRAITARFVRTTLALVAIGGAAGLPLVFLAGQSLSRLLHGVPPFDAVSIGTSTAVLAGAALLAGYLPARRAARVDPLQALRPEA